MIQITIEQDRLENIVSLEVSGHSGYQEAGYDIVCAAVSSQVISIENSLCQWLGYPIQVMADEDQGGYLKIDIPPVDSGQLHHDGQLLLKHLVATLKVHQEAYPDNISMTIQTQA